ncbi:MAG: hypothetical protein AAF960_02785 [Bacteroidota bacterium]
MDNNQSTNKDWRDQLNRRPHDWDTEQLWVEIEKDLPKKRRPAVWYWLFGGTALLVTSLLVGTYFLSETASKTVSETAVRPTTSSTVLESTTDVLPKTNTITSTTKTTSLPKTDAVQAFVRPEKPQKTTLTEEHFPLKPTQQVSSLIINQPKLAKQKPTLTSTFTTNLPVTSKVSASKVSSNRAVLPALETYPITPLPIANLEPSFPKGKNGSMRSVQISKNTFSLLFYQSISHVWTSFELKNTAQQSQLDRRLATERPLESWSTGLSAKWQFLPQFFVEAGLERQQITTLLQGTIRDETVRTVESDSAFFYTDVSGLRNYLAGAHDVRTITTQQLHNYNRTVLYNLPLAIGYEKEYGRLAFGLKGGVIVNWKQRFSGEFILPDDTLLDNESIQSAQLFSSNIGMGWQIGSHVRYQLRPRLDLQLTLQHRQFLGSLMEVTNNGYEQNLRTLGVQIGLSKRFN